MPQHAERFQAAVARHASGEVAAAASEYRAILKSRPDDVNVLYHLGVAEHQLHRLSDAALMLERALALAPDFAEGWQSLGAVRLEVGQVDHAVAAYGRALVLKPELLAARARLVAALLEQGSVEAATEWTLAGLRLAPGEGRLWDCLDRCLNALVTPDDPQRWRRFIPDDFQVLVGKAIEQGCVFGSGPVNGVLLNLLLDSLRAKADRFGDSLAVLADPVFAEIELLSFSLELALARVRRETLLAFAGGEVIVRLDSPATLAGLVNLAHILFRHEYVAFVSDAENELLASLESRIEADLARRVVDLAAVALLACYRPLNGLSSATSLSSHPMAREALAGLLRRQIEEPQQERMLAASIPRLTPIRHATSVVISRMYEENPYPRWQSLPAGQGVIASYAGHLARRLPGARFPAALEQGEFDLLVAGCGTGRQPTSTARSLPMARVLALDLSLASLSYAQRKVDEFGLPHIALAQADILELGVLSQRFPYIECAGVLHHLAEPLAGLRVLAALLEPGGIIQLALYSRTAREHFGVLAAQALAKEQCRSASAEEIRRFRMHLMASPQFGTDALMLKLRDFFSLSQCRDLLFHEMEHCYTPLEIGRLCADSGLEFLGFEEPVPGLFDRYAALFPDDPRRLDLEHWTTLELMEPGAFIGMYVFFAQKPW